MSLRNGYYERRRYDGGVHYSGRGCYKIAGGCIYWWDGNRWAPSLFHSQDLEEWKGEGRLHKIKPDRVNDWMEARGLHD